MQRNLNRECKMRANSWEDKKKTKYIEGNRNDKKMFPTEMVWKQNVAGTMYYMAKIGGHVTITPICWPCPKFYYNIGSTQLYTHSLYFVALQFTGTGRA